MVALNCDSRFWEKLCCGAGAGKSFWHGALPCLPMGIHRSFLYMLKAQAGEVQSKGNSGLRTDIFWWGWHRGLQPRLDPEERLPFPSHLSTWFWEKARTAPAERHLPCIHPQKSPAIHAGERQKDLPKTKFGSQSQLHAYLSQIDKRPARSPCPEFASPRYPPTVTPLSSGLQVFLEKHQSRRHTFQREHGQTQTVPCQERGRRVP